MTGNFDDVFASAAARRFDRLAACSADAPRSRVRRSTACRRSPSPPTAKTAPVGTAKADAADDPAIRADPANLGRALIVATDKKAVLHAYDLAGRDLAFLEGGRVNNVDVVGTSSSRATVTTV